jgi:hypothetical protein
MALIYIQMFFGFAALTIVGLKARFSGSDGW